MSGESVASFVFPVCIYANGGGKIHRPRNEFGYLHQADKTTAQARCGSRLRAVYRAEPVLKWLFTPHLLCRHCWTGAEVEVLTERRDRSRGWQR